VRKVAGQRAYDEGKTAVLAGMAAGVGILLSQGPAVFASVATWTWGIALPMSAVGIATHYLASLQRAWSQFWQQRERDRCGAASRLPFCGARLRCAGQGDRTCNE
jgi:hypothetical protein